MMMRMRVRLAGLSLTTLVLTGSLSAQDTTRTLRGVVMDSSGQAISYANVDAGGAHRTISDAQGRFVILLESSNRINVNVRRIGFLPASVRLESLPDTAIQIRLAPSAQHLAAMRIAAEHSRVLEADGFYNRMLDRELGVGGGEFVTPEEIELRHPARVTQLLDDRHGLLVRRVGSCHILVQCWAIFGPGGCIMTLYLNGQRLMPKSMFGRGTGLNDHKPTERDVVFLDELISASAVSGIEIYSRGSRAPPQYQTLNGTCGVVVLWTR
jgi:hypothetical protein